MKAQVDPARAYSGQWESQRQNRRKAWENRNQQRAALTRRVRIANFRVDEQFRER